uniref:Uncharacterized protein n=1 Tax=Oryza rufipogon TaxID=4529 RepID=A0A0E0R2H6_ORYRU
MAGTPGRRPPAAGSAPQRNPTGGRVMGVFVRGWRLVLRAFAGGEDGGAALGERGDASSGISDLGLWKMDLSDDVYQLLSEGVPWTEEEHRRFLLGLQKLGKGDWRGISRNFVVSRTPTQVASHAQKYFIRQSNMTRRKRRSSLFDMVPDESMDLPPLPGGQEPETQVLNQPALPPPREEEEVDSMESDTSAVAESSSASAIMPDNLQSTYPVIVPAYFSPFLQFSVPFWQNQKDEDGPVQETHEIVKPVPVHSKSPINVDELVGMSKLSIGESNQETVSTSLSLNLVGGQNRQSAFHANPPTRAQA